MGFFVELKRRHVVKVGLVYASVGFVVIQVATLLLPRMDVPEWAVNLVIGIVLLGFPIALVLTWALEVTPEGVKRTPPAPAGAGGDGGAAHGALDDRSIAVLPFTNLSRDPDNEYFSDGITEEILMALSKVRDLRVISRTSVMQYKGTFRAVRDIAQDLDVAHVLEGSVRRVGERVRIAAQLIDARTDEHLWAESYDRDLEDVFAIQSDVAERIVHSLRAALTPSEKARLEARPTESVEAYEWYLKGRHLFPRRTEQSLNAAREAFRKAVAADPGYAQAWSGLADALALLPSYGATPRDEVLPEARRAAERAVSLDPGLGEAHASLAFVARQERKWDEAEREFRRALELAPGYALAHHWYALLLNDYGRYDEAIDVLERVRQLDPVSLPIRAALGVTYMATGDLARAEATWREGLELDPDYVALHQNLIELYAVQGRLDEALAEQAAISRIAPDRCPPMRLSRLKEAYAAEGPPGYWRATVEWLDVHGRTGQDILDLATALLRLERVDEAIDRLRRGLFENRHPMAYQVGWLPQFEPIRSDPRIQALLREVRPA